MKKILSFSLLILIILVMNFSLSGCAQTASQDSEGYITTDSGLQYKEVAVGEGEMAKAGNTLSMHYTGRLTDGTKFDSSVDRGEPFSFTLGVGQVIAGWDEGVAGMRVGGKRELVIPYKLAYGEDGIPGVIPEKATLVFDVELLEIE